MKDSFEMDFMKLFRENPKIYFSLFTTKKLFTLESGSQKPQFGFLHSSLLKFACCLHSHFIGKEVALTGFCCFTTHKINCKKVFFLVCLLLEELFKEKKKLIL